LATLRKHNEIAIEGDCNTTVKQTLWCLSNM